MKEHPRHQVPYFEHDPEKNQPAHRVFMRAWPFRIGRSNEAELTIFSRRVSSFHAELVSVPNGHIIRDLGSTNGTFVNGKKIGEAWLKEGDVVHIAHKELRFGVAELEGNRPEPTLTQASGQQQLFRETTDLMRLFRDRAVTAVFQPIVRLTDRHVLGFETLGRISLENPSYSIGQMLGIAGQRGEAARLSKLLREVAVEDTAKLGRPHALFFNLHPKEMQDPAAVSEALDLMATIKQHGHQPVLEIHESAVTDGAAMAALRERLRERSIALAYDDFGAGQSRLMELVEVPPDTLKLDITLVREIDTSARRQDLVRAIVHVLVDQGIEVLAEGIEREEEAVVCQQLGCHLGQGYHLGRPAPVVGP